LEWFSTVRMTLYYYSALSLSCRQNRAQASTSTYQLFPALVIQKCFNSDAKWSVTTIMPMVWKWPSPHGTSGRPQRYQLPDVWQVRGTKPTAIRRIICVEMVLCSNVTVDNFILKKDVICKRFCLFLETRVGATHPRRLYDRKVRMSIFWQNTASVQT
jgi:hypothetical protein